MNKGNFYDNFFELLPPYPLSVLEFLKTELQLGKKYIVMDIHNHNGQFGQLLLKHIRLLCSLTPDPEHHLYLKNKLKGQSNFLSINAIPELTNIEEDSIDCLCIDTTINKFNIARMGIEFERILRLNSYVLIIQNQLLDKENSFSNAFQRIALEEHLHLDSNSKLPTKSELDDFYNNSYKEKAFPNQQRLSWEQLKAYWGLLHSLDNKQIRSGSLERLEGLFNKYQTEGEVVLDYATVLYYGLFNHSVPEISLRKSIFFNALRPFAFGFYVLVKANIYFWRMLYTVKDKLFGRNKKIQ